MRNLVVKFCFLILLTVCSSSKDESSSHSSLSLDDCPAGWFKCSNGKCIASVWICDGSNDCGNSDDEIDCENKLVPTNICFSSQFKCKTYNHCIPEKWHCDGEPDCRDKSDEQNCENVTTCTGFKCRNNQCIPSKWHCDGQPDCSSGEDEELCEKRCSDKEFTCSSGSCLNLTLVCNGKNDCVDGSDEGMHCPDSCKNSTCSQHCERTPSGPRCYCDEGFVLDKNDNKTCRDINECEVDGFCSHTCVNTRGSYRCICNSGYELINRTCRAAGPDPLLIFSIVKEVRGMKLRSKQYFPIRNAESRITAVDVDPYSEKIYWIDVSNKSTVYSADLDGRGLKTVLSHGLLVPEDIAVDYLAHNVYLTDSGLKQILACKTDGKYCHVLHDTNVERPRSLVLDMKNGLMYWSDWGDQSAGIYRSSMDGSNRIPLVSKVIGGAIGWPNGIALDPSTNRLYWADAKLSTIEFISLDHSRTRKVINSSIVVHPYSLAVFEDTVYWSDWYSYKLESCNKFTGWEVTTIAREHVMGIHVYHPVLAAAEVSNPCWSHDCSHLCLRSAGRGYTCACPHGYKLVGDLKTCALEPHGASIFVSEGSTVFQIRPKSVGSDVLTELSLPLGNAVISRVAFDSRSKFLFVADITKPAIYAVNMNSQEIHELAQNQVVLPADLAFDWTSNNLYWIDSSKGTAEVINVFFDKSVTLLTNLQPVALAISPNSGHMFIASIGTRSVVKMYGMDGKNEKTLSSVSGVTVALALHPMKSLLYLADFRTNAILYVNYTTSRSVQILKSRIDGVMSLAVGEEDIYWTARKRELNIMVGKASFVLQLPGERNYAVPLRVTYSQGATPGSPDRLCLVRNGGCSYVCLTSPSGRTCACPSDMMLSEDNVTCLAKPCNASYFKCMSGQCLKGEKKCDGVLDCEDETDEINCTSRCSADDFQCKNGKCILKSWQCDFRNDCGDDSDESDCPKAANCTKDQIMCLNGECISVLWRCDGEADCLDGSDESNCHATECSGNHVRCDNGQCVPMEWICDGSQDCLDGSDEGNCTKKDRACTIHEFRCESDGSCLEKVMRCNGRAECNDGSDEKNCTQHKDGCKSGMFVCKDRSCVYDYEVCDGHNDCSQNEDELNCTHEMCEPEEMLCRESKRCISKKWICDGDVDCEDGSDEEGCVETTTRLPTLPPLSEVGLCSKMNCQQKCRSTILGPRCYCNDGFQLDVQDNRTCIDIDECLSMNICNGSKCINTNGSFTCACYDGFYHIYAGDCVNFDIKDSEFIFYNEGFSVYIIKRKDGDKRIDLLQEFQRPITGLSFQPKTQILYISDEEPSIYAVNMSSLHVRILVKNGLSSPKDIEFDWMSNNLYWVDTEKGSIEVISVDTQKRKVLIDDLSKPVSLAISPYRGNMFVSENGFDARVSMYGMDGRNGRVLPSVQGFILSLALHPSETLLYWSDQRQEIISSTNYTTQGSTLILRHIKGVMSVASSEDRIFYTADEASLQKDRGSSDGKVHIVELFGKGKDKSWKSMTYSHGIKPSGKSECLIENGGCSYLCLTSPNGRTCACPSAMTLNKDGRSCLGKQCAENDFRCSDGRCIPFHMKCDGNVDCNDATDEQDCGS